MSKYAKLMTEPVPQSEPLNDRQVENNAGGFVFQIDDWARLERFLILGSDAPTYYQKAEGLTRENAACVLRCYAADPARTVKTIVDISVAGRAAKNDAAVFALALGAADTNVEARRLALAAMPKVCRTGTHLFQFVDATLRLGRGFGRTMKRAIARWYDDKPVDRLAYQLIKYRQREGYSHNRLIDLSHPTGASDPSPARHALYRWAVGMPTGARPKARPRTDVSLEQLPALVTAHLEVMTTKDKARGLELIREHRLPWEALPTEARGDVDAWKAMLPHLGLTALIRNLGNLSRLGVIKPLSSEEQLIVHRLTNEDELRKARIHPFKLLLALSVYAVGASPVQRGKEANRWTPSQAVCDALDKAFYKAFRYVEPTGKRHLLGIDVSASMSAPMAGSVLRCNQAAAALALVTMNVEPACHAMMFDQGMRPANISPRDRLDTATRRIADINGGGTDCSLPMLYAAQHGLEVDAFVVITDNETWAGRMHPVEALRRYRKQTGIPAKLVVIAMTATPFTIADPSDPGMLDMVGFDANGPAIMSAFISDGRSASAGANDDEDGE